MSRLAGYRSKRKNIIRSRNESLPLIAGARGHIFASGTCSIKIELTTVVGSFLMMSENQMQVGKRLICLRGPTLELPAECVRKMIVLLLNYRTSNFFQVISRIGIIT